MKGTCFIYANCQGAGIRNFLCLSRDFSRRFHVETFSNWEARPFPARRLSACDLLIHQPTADRGDLAPSTGAMRAALRPGALSVSFPYLYFNGFWPFHERSGNADTGKCFPRERHYYADSMLDRLARTELPVQRVVKIYLGLDFTGDYDVRAGCRASLRYQEEKEQSLDVVSHDLVAALWRKKRLFLTVRHPTNLLYYLVANRILEKIGLPALDAGLFAAAPSPYAVAYEHPIHPCIADVLGLSWLGEDPRYMIWGEAFSYPEYLADYVAFRRLQYAAGRGEESREDRRAAAFAG
jgi:hypothetical protein